MSFLFLYNKMLRTMQPRPKRLPVGKPNAEKSFWTVKEAARYLSIAPMTLYCWIKPQTQKKPSRLLGPPPLYRFGPNCIRFPINEFIEWAENFRQGSP